MIMVLFYFTIRLNITEGEVKRKQQLELVYSRPKEIEQREDQLREQLRKIEAIKKKRLDEEKREKRANDKREKEKKRSEKKKKKKSGEEPQDGDEQPPQDQSESKNNAPEEGDKKESKTPGEGNEKNKQTNDEKGQDRKGEESESEEEQESLVANNIRQLKPGAYARSALMSAPDKNEVDSMIDIVMQEHEIHKTPMPTSKIHEAYEQLRNRITFLLDVKIKVGKYEVQAQKLKYSKERLLNGTDEKKESRKRKPAAVKEEETVEPSATEEDSDTKRPNKRRKQ
jgi:hypothetical protein